MINLDQEKIYQIYFQASLKYNEIINSNKGDIAREYLNSRCIDLKFINEFLIGYVPSYKFIYDEFLRSGQFDFVDLYLSNLLSLDEEKGFIKDYFGPKRIIFPVFENGKIETFSSRSLSDDIKPKYKTLKFNKMAVFNSSILLSKPKRIYICEGVIDTLSLLSMGLKAIGILGIQVFGMENLSIFNGYKGEIVLVFDNDENESGQKAIKKIGNLLYNFGLENIYFKQLPKNEEDPKMDINKFLCHYKSSAYIEFAKIPFEKVEREEVNKINCSYNSLSSNNLEEFDILEQISKIVELKPESSSRMRCECPFPSHNDKTPSFVIYTSENRYKCFGCGKSGDTIQFIRDYYGLSFKQALEKLRGQ